MENIHALEFSQYVQQLNFDAFNLTVLTDTENSYVFYHFVIKDDAMKQLSLFKSTLKTTAVDFLGDLAKPYNATEIGGEHFCVTTHTPIDDYNDRILCHLFPNAVNTRFYEVFLNWEDLRGFNKHSKRSRKIERMEQCNSTRSKDRDYQNKRENRITNGGPAKYSVPKFTNKDSISH